MLLHTSNCTTDHTPYVEVNSSSLLPLALYYNLRRLNFAVTMFGHTPSLSVFNKPLVFPLYYDAVYVIVPCISWAKLLVQVFHNVN